LNNQTAVLGEEGEAAIIREFGTRILKRRSKLPGRRNHFFGGASEHDDFFRLRRATTYLRRHSQP
jgi:hypothetical protein